MNNGTKQAALHSKRIYTRIGMADERNAIRTILIYIYLIDLVILKMCVVTYGIISTCTRTLLLFNVYLSSEKDYCISARLFEFCECAPFRGFRSTLYENSLKLHDHYFKHE